MSAAFGERRRPVPQAHPGGRDEQEVARLGLTSHAFECGMTDLITSAVARR
ncbi:hypothetical protein [Streptomyces sp. NBC_00829]|uniref:hypothetical protein n=1 Tax=Streptomyces sp. NBC_00829 TaxID=2903679 RepID=UPI00386FBFAD|nr:hypothetical protein OG293_35055 [Streptomyces sp. NBC_00829]